MARLKRHIRKSGVWQLAQEVHNAASCLGAIRGAISRQVGLNPERWRVLAAIETSPYCLSISDLARRLRLSRQSLHRLTAELERGGLVRLLPNDHDHRLLQLELTMAGRASLAAAEYRFSTWLLVMANGLSEREVWEMLSVVRAVRERFARARSYV
jgi:DNA-binding MarR family transcriptional regulator